MAELTLKQKFEDEIAALETQATQMAANLNFLNGAKKAYQDAIAHLEADAKAAIAALEADIKKDTAKDAGKVAAALSTPAAKTP